MGHPHLPHKAGFAKPGIVMLLLSHTNNHRNMRALLFPLLMVALSVEAANPEEMIVMVRTTDRVIVDFTCVGQIGYTGSNELFKSEIADRGGLTWSVVGGVAPYTMVKDETNGNEHCITVKDANGREATGCGVIAVVHQVRQVNCLQTEQERLEKKGVFSPAPSGVDSASVRYPAPPVSPLTPTGLTPVSPNPPVQTGTPVTGVTPVSPTPVPAPTEPQQPPVIKQEVPETGYTTPRHRTPTTAPRTTPHVTNRTNNTTTYSGGGTSGGGTTGTGSTGTGVTHTAPVPR